MAARVVLITRSSCHLCDDARQVVASLCGDVGVAFEEVDVDANSALRDEHGDFVPVVLVDGVRRGFWTIDADQLRSALA
jgi:glutaredoxin